MCEGNHPIHLCPLMDESSKGLENLTLSQLRLLTGYRKLSPNPSLVDPIIDQKLSLVNPALPESESCGFVLDQPLVEKPVDPAPPSVNRTFLVESEAYITQVLLVS